MKIERRYWQVGVTKTEDHLVHVYADTKEQAEELASAELNNTTWQDEEIKANAFELEPLKFGLGYHLGRSDKDEDQDQRVTRDQYGNYYFYDWSGDSPDTTDDGPLRWDTSKSIEVDHDHCFVSVIALASKRKSRVGVTHFGLAKFFEMVNRDSPHLLEQPMGVTIDDKVAAIHSLLVLGKITVKGLRAVS